ncbi:unnamed protein product [Gordionus sp. m RMFG-2023]
MFSYSSIDKIFCDENCFSSFRRFKFKLKGTNKTNDYDMKRMPMQNKSFNLKPTFMPLTTINQKEVLWEEYLRKFPQRVRLKMMRKNYLKFNCDDGNNSFDAKDTTLLSRITTIPNYNCSESNIHLSSLSSNLIYTEPKYINLCKTSSVSNCFTTILLESQKSSKTFFYKNQLNEKAIDQNYQSTLCNNFRKNNLTSVASTSHLYVPEGHHLTKFPCVPIPMYIPYYIPIFKEKLINEKMEICSMNTNSNIDPKNDLIQILESLPSEKINNYLSYKRNGNMDDESLNTKIISSKSNINEFHNTCSYGNSDKHTAKRFFKTIADSSNRLNSIMNCSNTQKIALSRRLFGKIKRLKNNKNLGTNLVIDRERFNKLQLSHMARNPFKKDDNDKNEQSENKYLSRDHISKYSPHQNILRCCKNNSPILCKVNDIYNSLINTTAQNNNNIFQSTEIKDIEKTFTITNNKKSNSVTGNRLTKTKTRINIEPILDLSVNKYTLHSDPTLEERIVKQISDLFRQAPTREDTNFLKAVDLVIDMNDKGKNLFCLHCNH